MHKSILFVRIKKKVFHYGLTRQDSYTVFMLMKALKRRTHEKRLFVIAMFTVSVSPRLCESFFRSKHLHLLTPLFLEGAHVFKERVIAVGDAVFVAGFVKQFHQFFVVVACYDVIKTVLFLIDAF